MKIFNKKIEEKKLEYKKNKDTYIKRLSISLACITLLFIVALFTFAKFETNSEEYTLINGKLTDTSSGDVVLSYTVDGQNGSLPPSKDNYMLTNVSCTNADVTYDNVTWDLNIKNYTGKVKCNLTFIEKNFNNVPKWLQTANINKNYTTLSEVLNDSATLQALINNNSSCNYLMYSTEWMNSITSNESAMTYIGNNNYCGDLLAADDNWIGSIIDSTYFDKVLLPLVPTMTSDTEPRGEAFSSSLYTSTTQSFKAFNGNHNDGWLSRNIATSSAGYIGYDFVNNVVVKAASISNYVYDANVVRLKDFKIQGSNASKTDGYTDIYTGVYPNKVNSIEFYKFNNKSDYKYIRFYITSSHSSGYYIGARDVQFYGREKIQ